MASLNSIPSKNDIYLELDSQEKYYTPGQTISGQLIIAANTSIQVEALAVSLESVSESCVVDKNNKKQTESHYLVYQLCEIIPLADATNVIAPTTSAVPVGPTTFSDPATDTFGTSATTAATAVAAPANLATLNTPTETITDRGIFSSKRLSSLKLKKQSSMNSNILKPGYHRFRFQLNIPLKGHCYVTSTSSNDSAEKELHNHVSRYLPSSLPLLETPILENNSNVINYYLKSIIKRNLADSLQDIVTFKGLQVKAMVDLNNEKGYEYSLQDESLLKLPEFEVEVPILLKINNHTPNLAIVESYNESSQSILVDFESLDIQIFSKLNIPQLVKFGSPLASKQINLQMTKIEIFSNFKVLAGNEHTNKSKSICVLNTNSCGIQFPMSLFENFKSSDESFINFQSLKIAKFNNVILNETSKLIQSFTTCNLKQEYFADITLSLKLVPVNKNENCSEPIPVFITISVPVELYYRDCLSAVKNLNTTEEPGYILFNNAKLYYQNNAPLITNKLSNRISKCEGVASEISETLSGKLNKLSMRIGKENPKLGNKISHFVNEGNLFFQQKLGNNETNNLSFSTQPMFDNKIQQDYSSNPTLSSLQNHALVATNSNSTPTATLTSPAPQPGPSITQDQGQAPAYNTASSILLESGKPATGDIKGSNAGSSSQTTSSVVTGNFLNAASTSSSGADRLTTDESELPPPPSYDESLHNSLSEILSNDTK